ncbi:ABC transporter substrate-binding protein [Sorangium sp. So ce726]|uniref:ABC transporter substrate-binding protein n=1 Tax=Sorangium sp. So ce726 TaxID=3133319 RepID=UPI003F5F3A60
MSGCAGNGDSTEESTVVIGAILPDTGLNANPYFIQAAEMAFEQFNEALAGTSASRGLRFKLEKRDDQSDPTTVKPLATELLGLGSPVLVTATSVTSMTVNNMNYVADSPAKVPVVCGSCTNMNLNNPDAAPTPPTDAPGYQDLDNWLRRTTITASRHAETMFRDIFSRGSEGDGDLDGDGTVNVSIISDVDRVAYTGELRSAQHPPTPGIVDYELLAVDTHTDPNSIDFAGLVAGAFDEINADDSSKPKGPPDFIVNWVGPTFAVGVAKAYKQAGYTVPMLNSSSFRRAAMLQTLGTMAEGQEGVSNLCWTADASGDNFAKAFAEETGADPAGYDSSVYDSMVVALLGTVKAALALDDPSKVTGSDVNVALDQINDPSGTIVRTGTEEFKKAIEAIAAGKSINYEGASGPCDFDSVGNVKGDIAVYKVQNGKFVELRTYACTKDDTCRLATK